MSRHEDSPSNDADRQAVPWGRLVVQQLESLQRAGVTILPRCEARELPPMGVRDAIEPPRDSGRDSVSPAASSRSPESASPSPHIDTNENIDTNEISSSGEQVPNMSPARRPPSPSPAPSKAPSPAEPKGARRSTASLKAKLQALEILQEEVCGCTRCPELVASRTQTVFGVGNPQARLCFFGEAPGADEDRQGEPFVGKAGQLLTKILEACSLRREDIYILNTLRCRPPKNRNPLPEEIANCRPFFERQLEVIQPEFICCLGAVAARALLETTTPVGKLRGKFHEFRGAKVLVTYHPAYLLRNPSMKRETWEDMKLLMREMGIPLPEGK